MVQLKLQDINDYNCFQFIAAEMKIPEKRIEQNSSRLDLLYLSFRLLCKELANLASSVLCFQDLTFSNMMHFILMSDSLPKLESQTKAFALGLEDKITNMLKLEMKVGIGKAVHSLEDFKNGYASSLLDRSLKVQGNAGSVHITPVTQDFSTETERRMVVELERGNKQAFQTLLTQLVFPEKPLSAINFSFLAVRIVIMIRSLAARYSSDQENPGVVVGMPIRDMAIFFAGLRIPENNGICRLRHAVDSIAEKHLIRRRHDRVDLQIYPGKLFL